MTDKYRFDIVDPVLALPRPAKRAIVLSLDVLLCVVTVWLAFYLRLDDWISIAHDPVWRADWAAVLSIVIAIPLFVTQGFYRVIFRHAGAFALSMAVRAFLLYGFLYATAITVIGIAGIPRSIGIIQPILLLMAVGASRLVAYYWLGGAYQRILKRASLPRAVIYGAGVAGRQLARAMAHSYDMRIVGFVDDNPRLKGQVMLGLPIFAADELDAIVRARGVTSVLLAMPSASRPRRLEILARLEPLGVMIRALPGVDQLVQGKVTFTDLRELEIEDLLGRNPVAPEPRLMARNITDKAVLVTGAGGSIGSELCRQILALKPSLLVLLDVSEFALYQIHAELQAKAVLSNDRLVSVLASVQDADGMRRVMQAYRPDTVYHAAAYKHVSLVQANPLEGLCNNTYGTLVTAQASIDAGVALFVLVSTDKAVRPTNVMGASKRLAEMILQALAASDARHTCFCMVRFGNVLGSSGSVVPKFRQQIREGGPITLTDPEVTRYFMTIPEAAQLVIQAGAMATRPGGEVFVLDMGEPVKIRDLAYRMVALSGLTVKDEHHPDGDVAIQIIGLRPGEKRYEELLIGDNVSHTEHPRILQACESYQPWNILERELDRLLIAIKTGDLETVHGLLHVLVSGYQPDKGAGAVGNDGDGT